MSGFTTDPSLNQAEYSRLKAAFVARGTTLNAWCKANDTHIQNVRDAAFGNWKGPSAEALLERVLDAAREPA